MSESFAEDFQDAKKWWWCDAHLSDCFGHFEVNCANDKINQGEGTLKIQK